MTVGFVGAMYAVGRYLVFTQSLAPMLPDAEKVDLSDTEDSEDEGEEEPVLQDAPDEFARWRALNSAMNSDLGKTMLSMNPRAP